MEKMIVFIIENTFFLAFLVGVIFFIASFISLKFPPKKINYLYGYRTNSSMKSQEIWNFSQRFSSFAMMKSSVVLILLSLTNFFFQLDEKFQLIIGLGLVILATIFVFVSTEKAIKKNFTNS
jgi:uncharacterized membrane protein